jgi:hypothetical protein
MFLGSFNLPSVLRKGTVGSKNKNMIMKLETNSENLLYLRCEPLAACVWTTYVKHCSLHMYVNTGFIFRENVRYSENYDGCTSARKRYFM